MMVRHGEADHNVTEAERAGSGSGVIVHYVEDGEKRICDTELTETGRRQALLVAERLQQERIDLAAASDLRRARDTALAVARLHNKMQVHTWKIGLCTTNLCSFCTVGKRQAHNLRSPCTSAVGHN